MKNIANYALQSGIIGAGGAGFPTHIKLSSKAKTFIVNAVECEPLLHKDKMIIKHYPEEVINGMCLAMESIGAERGIFALKSKYKECISILKPVLEKAEIKAEKKYKIELLLLDDFYPAGDEIVLCYEATGKIVPEAGLPLAHSIVVNNVETLYNLSLAQKEAKPLIKTWLTITGEVKNPQTFLLPIGMNIKEALDLAGGVTIDDYIIIDGGPMMGKVVSDDDAISKTTGGLLVFPKEHPLVQFNELKLNIIAKRAMSACIQCRMCSDLCPRNLLGHNLEPHLMMRYIAFGLSEKLVPNSLLCCECGVCENFACPMGLSPRQIVLYFKEKAQAIGQRWQPTDTSYIANEERYARRVPINRLIARLGLTNYYKDAPLNDINYSPKSVKLSLQMHIGAPSEPIVKIGDKVHRGQLIAKIPMGKLGANLHSSIDGIVKNIDDNYIIIVLS